jgi:hypothetical protein
MLLIEFMNIPRNSFLRFSGAVFAFMFSWNLQPALLLAHASANLSVTSSKFTFIFAGSRAKLFVYQQNSERGRPEWTVSRIDEHYVRPQFHVLHAEIKFNWENPYLLCAIGPGWISCVHIAMTTRG